MSVDVEPTPERVRKAPGRIEAPAVDAKTRRVAYRVLSAYEALYRAGRISEPCKHAADKLLKHWLGSLGHDVRTGEGGGEPIEHPAIYHAQKVAEARAVIDCEPQWQALIALIEETATLEAIGRAWLGWRDRAQAYAAGLSLVQLGLHRLARHWGYTSEEFHDRRD